MYRYRVNYGLKSDDRVRTTFIVDTPSPAAGRAHDIAQDYYDNMIERGIIFDDSLVDHVERVRKELAERNWTDWSEDAIWNKAFDRYCKQREFAIWYNYEEIN